MPLNRWSTLFVAAVTIGSAACTGDLPTAARNEAVDLVAVTASDQLPLLEGGCEAFAYQDYAGWHGVNYDPTQYLEPGQIPWYFEFLDEDGIGHYGRYANMGWWVAVYNPETQQWDEHGYWVDNWGTERTTFACSE